MKVIVSIDSIRFPLTGIGRYTLELVNHLSKTSGLDLRLLAGPVLTNSIPRPSAEAPALPVASLKRRILKLAPVTDALEAIHSLAQWRTLRTHRDAIFHGPNYYLPPFDGPAVVTVHDLSIYKYPECHPRERVRYMKKKIPQSLARADLIITDSEFTRKEVSTFFDWPIDRILAIPLAASDNFHPRGPEETTPVLQRHGLQYQQYSFFSGTIEPRKNIEVLLDAYADLPGSLRDRCPLVVCGYQGWENEALRLRIDRYAREGWLKYLGYVPEDELSSLLAGARTFLYPSRYEGFGLPVLEAMASGIPVICSNASSLPEVAGDAADTHDPDDVETLRDLIRTAILNCDWRTDRAERGLRRAEQYSWAETARETARAYSTLAAISAHRPQNQHP
jgi:alpha-1,3-rhamnosyl/mannosyltransferase